MGRNTINKLPVWGLGNYWTINIDERPSLTQDQFLGKTHPLLTEIGWWMNLDSTIISHSKDKLPTFLVEVVSVS